MRPKQRPTYAGNDVEKVYHMLRPKPKPLLVGQRELVRHGELGYFSPNTVSRKMRYFFLFSDCLLLTKRDGQAKFQLKIYMHLRGAIKLVTMNGSPTHEFRLLIPEKGTLKKRKERRIILFGKTEEHKQAWIRDLQRCLWEANGRKGPDPSKGPIKDTTYDEEEYQEEESDSPPPQRKPRAAKPAGQPRKKEIEEVEDLSGSDSDSSDDETQARAGSKPMGDPLIVFDPFGADDHSPQGTQSGGADSQYKGFDARGQAIPRGVMLPPLSGDQQPAQAGTGIGGYAGVQQGVPGQYGMGVSGVQGSYGAPGYSSVSVSQYGSGGIPGLMPVMGNPALVSPYGQGMFLPTGGIGVGPIGVDQSAALYGAAGGVATGLGGMFATAPGSGGLAPYGSGGFAPTSGGFVGVGGAGAYSSGGFGGVSGVDRGFDSAGGSGGIGSGGIHGGAEGINTGSTGAQAALDDLAYKELQEATRVIESIAAELAARPRKVSGADLAPDAPMTIDHVSDAILNGTGALARAASVLLKATAAAQKERVERDINDFHSRGTPYHSDPVWANGLISAGRYVVATTQLLVDTANKLMNGEAKEEQLTACAQSVAVATTQLVVAEKTKGNLNSPTHLQLEDAAVGIRRATNQLVDAAKLHYDTQKTQTPTPAPLDMSKMRMTESKVAQLEAQARLLQLEAETQRAREELARLRKDEYISPRGNRP
eukprot:TRINITY_DN90_c0_g1_i2.p1 TRINITY_DN90_c0_g1~~TRINITY_DN90_c0_g1_i2.p1  ORF type:complete len:707 (+),score=152.02 TRINITY_DN90_c0_g1_i2:367-2487(+)